VNLVSWKDNSLNLQVLLLTLRTILLLRTPIIIVYRSLTMKVDSNSNLVNAVNEMANYCIQTGLLLSEVLEILLLRNALQLTRYKFTPNMGNLFANLELTYYSIPEVSLWTIRAVLLLLNAKL